MEHLEESVIYSDLFDEKVKHKKSLQPVTNTKVKQFQNPPFDSSWLPEKLDPMLMKKKRFHKVDS